jgi:ABC-type multidrug transport system fused ATPase/permease subunit
MKYRNDSDYVLKGLTFSIKPGEKIGIVGRTGAGKSSLIQAIFRMTETTGKLLIDDIDIKSVGLHTLR